MFGRLKKTLNNVLFPESDFESEKRAILEKIKHGAKHFDPYTIDKILIPDYVRAGGKREDVEKYLEEAKINYAKRLKNPPEITCPRCKPYGR